MNKIFASILLSNLLLLATTPLSAERKPLPRPTLKKIKHQPTGTNLRYNPKTKQSEEYELAGKIIYDEKTGNFLLRWTGMDGRRKTIVYEPATRLDAVIAARVDHDPKGNVYRYSYLLSNLPTSERKLQSFYLETQALIDNVKAPDATWGHSTALTDYLRQQFQVEAGWTWSQTRHGRVGLLPGEKAVGFSYLSLGLPGVVKCYVRHHAYLKGVGEGMPEELNAALDPLAWKIPQGVTVGPVAPPEIIHPATFARKLIEMLDVSIEQGWIESPSVAQEMRTLLGNAAAAFDRGELERASDLLESLLKRVEEENEQTLLSEAYALLKFNVEFLLAHIDGK